MINDEQVRRNVEDLKTDQSLPTLINIDLSSKLETRKDDYPQPIKKYQTTFQAKPSDTVLKMIIN